MTTDIKRDILKNTAVVAVMTIISRITGVVRELAKAIFLGTGIGADAFTIAYMIPNLLRRLVAEGAMSAAFIPVLSEYLHKDKRKELYDFLSNFFGFICFVVTLITIVGIAAAPFYVKHLFAYGFRSVPGKVELTVVLTQIMFVYIVLISISAFFQALLNAHHLFSVPASTPIFLNLTIIAFAYFFSRYFSEPSYAFSIGVVLGGILQVVIQIPWVMKLGLLKRPRISWKHQGVKKATRLLIPSLFGISVYQIDIALSEIIATTLPEGSVSSLQYSMRLVELTLGVVVISIATVILPIFSRQASSGQFEELKDTLRFSLRLIAFIGFPATVGLLVLSREIVASVYMYGQFDTRSLELTAFALQFHGIGLFFIGASRMLIQPFYSLQDTKTPVIISFFVMITNVTLCFILSHFLANGGIALGSSLSCALQCILLLFALRKKIGLLGLRSLIIPFAKIMLASLGMGAICMIPHLTLALEDFSSILQRLLYMSGILVSAGVSYVIFSYLTKSHELQEIVTMIKSKFIRPSL